jgi:tRNA pseudouridine32 synthase/23S rRNA pseudouridine746 synthase
LKNIMMQPQADPFIVPVCHDEITVIYQDDSFLLINKPTGLLSLSGKHPRNKDSVHYRLVQDFPTATLVHRLDFGTSGIMLVALSKEVNGNLTRQFQARSVKKTYKALLYGEMADNSGVIDFPIAKDKDNFPLQKICYRDGKEAVTRYRVIEKIAGNCTKVEFTPSSGRTHQLRIHSREIGHPILGCDLYGSDEAFVMAERLMLHATTLEFFHPATGEIIQGVSNCPF